MIPVAQVLAIVVAGFVGVAYGAQSRVVGLGRDPGFPRQAGRS